MGPQGERFDAARALVEALRPRHWIKNLFVVAPWGFAGELGNPSAAARALAAFAIFCGLSSAVYLVNDVADREADRFHPKKRDRPVASGRLTVAAASLAAAGLFAVGLSGAILLGRSFAAAAAVYAGLNLAYSFALKRVVILDVMSVSAGFLLRAWGGALAIGAEVSHWLVLCTVLLSLFLGFVKRRQELVSLGGASSVHRPILAEYSVSFLDQMITVAAAATVLAYALYAFSPEVAEKLRTRHMGWTLPFVLFGIFRYLYLVHQRGEGDNPTAVLLGDRPLLVAIAAWAVSAVLAIYVWP